jgi:RHS repeat-associated protein
MYHAATGLYWMRARWYAPQWGRFLTPEAFARGPDSSILR